MIVPQLTVIGSHEGVLGVRTLQADALIQNSCFFNRYIFFTKMTQNVYGC